MPSLVDSLRPRVEIMASSIAARMRAANQWAGMWTDYTTDEHLIGELISENAIRWNRPETVSGRSKAVIITDNIQALGLTSQVFGEENVIEGNVTERYHQNIEVAKGAVWEDTVSHTFATTTSREDAYKQGLSLAAKQSIRVGAGSTVTGVAGTFDFEEKFTADFEQRYGSGTQNSDTLQRKLTITGPFAGIYEFVRSRNKVEQTVTAKGDYEFGFTIRDEHQVKEDWGAAANWWNDVFAGGSRGTHNLWEVSFSSFAQFLSVIQVEAPSDAPLYDVYRARPEEPYWIGRLKEPPGDASFLIKFDSVLSADVLVRESIKWTALTPATPIKES